MRRNKWILASLCVVGSLAIVACGKSDATSQPGSGDKAAGETKPAAAKLTKLEKVGLSVELPADAIVTDGVGDNSVMISTSAASLTVSPAKATDPKTVEDGKGAALATENLKTEKLADGWIVSSENTGSLGRNYWLTMRREIGGKGYMCETMQSNEGQRQAAIAICKGLKP